jgi:hypothetical protein
MEASLQMVITERPVLALTVQEPVLAEVSGSLLARWLVVVLLLQTEELEVIMEDVVAATVVAVVADVSPSTTIQKHIVARLLQLVEAGQLEALEQFMIKTTLG